MKNKFSLVLISAIIALSAATTQSFAQTKTIQACKDEYKAQKAANPTLATTQLAYVAKCRLAAPAAAMPAAPAATMPAPATAAKPAAAMPAAPAAAMPAAPAAAMPAAAAVVKPAPAAAMPAAASAEFATEVAAKGRCPADTVVWNNKKSGVYHFAGTKDYGTTKNGAYMCEKDAIAANDRAAKNEKHP